MHSIRYTLYKTTEHDYILDVVQYLYHINNPMFPTVIVKHRHPANLILPAIYDHAENVLYEGDDGCQQFFETYTREHNLFQRAALFKEEQPSYIIS